MKTTRVHLVGAGPGDPELLTLKAARLIQLADVIVYDRLVGEGILSLAQDRCVLHYVGKTPGRHAMSQNTINDLLVTLARADHIVVRLKGGDPFIFGRGGEEAAYLLSHGIGVEVVPGITAASGCAAALGLPLTHRGVATSVRFVTGHCRADKPLDFDWTSLADPQTTLVFYMGLSQINEISSQLMLHGMPPGTAIAAVSKGTTAGQRIVRARLATVAANPEVRTLPSPTLFIIGPVVDAIADFQPVVPAELSWPLQPMAGHA